ncbi:glycosyltransferase [Shewanella sp. SM34]|uniref:glycosyltransferase n=1 Tax=unclassified Shewanella TaxID=196818 RepID=UPI0021D86C79|nr:MULTISPECIES: glycosyltransferase [unclassified Shewanella]MCU8055571.1 glycosyltransferase [Shewanella sp. SM35]MCU8064493.1 glycosyltransferase [Shewanella sp. SM34]
MKKVVNIITAQMYDGGTASVSYNYYRMFISLGYDVKLFILDDLPLSNKFKVDDSAIQYLNLLGTLKYNSAFWSVKGSLQFFSNFKKAILILSKLEGDVIFVHFTPILLGIISKLFHSNKYKYIYTLHTNIFSYSKNLSFIKKNAFNIFMFFFRFADFVIFLTKDVSEKYEELLKDSNFTVKCAVRYIPNSYSPLCTSFNSNDIDKFRISYNLDESQFLLFSGRLSYEKNVDFIIKSYRRYIDCGGKKKLLIAGDGPERNNLIFLTKSLLLSEYVVFLGNIDNIELVYSISDTLILASNHEGFGMVLLEAIDFGLHIISSNCPSGPSTIFDMDVDIILDTFYENELGYLLPIPNENNINLYADTILRLDSCSQLDSDIRYKVLSQFSLQSISNYWFDVLNSNERG